MTGVSRNPYNDAVRRHFANPRHAGDLQAGYPRVPVGEASGGGAGHKVVLAAELTGNTMTRLRFRVFGCPHLIAGADALCSRFEGLEPTALREFSVADLMNSLEVPVEKTGRMLLLEDAVQALAEAIRREQTGSGKDRRD